MIEEPGEKVAMTFTGKTTLWDNAEYTFTCHEDKVLYGYKVYRKGSLDNARFFEGFLKDPPAWTTLIIRIFAAQVEACHTAGRSNTLCNPPRLRLSACIHSR